MEFNNDIENLINGLYYPSIFYIPKVITKDFSETAKQELQDFGLFEDVGILKTDGTVESVKNDLYTMQLMGKKNRLENNFFQLLKFRDQLSLDAFNFIKNEYLRHAKACAQIYTWLYNNIGVETHCVTDSQKQWFELQKNEAAQHVENLRTKFSWIETFRRADFSKMDIKVPNLFKNKRYGEILNQSLKESTKKKPIQKTKTYKISDKEADEFLLQTVFNVKLPKPSKKVKGK